MVDAEEKFLAWNIPGAISPRLQGITEDAVSALVTEVPDLLQEPEQGHKNVSSSKFGWGIADFSPSAMSGIQEASYPNCGTFDKLMSIRNLAQHRL